LTGLRRQLRAGLSALSLLSLAACLSDGDAVPETAAPAAQPAEHVVISALPETVRAAPAAPAYPEIATLTGQPAAHVEGLLGAPKFRRRDKPAELWQYRAESCVLNLFLYPGGGHDLQVDHVEVQGQNGVTPAQQACFVTLLKAKEAAEAS